MNAMTLDRLKKKGDDEQEEGKGNEYYAGGAGRDGGSGLSVLGPPDGGEGGGPRSFADNIMQRARRDTGPGREGPPPGGARRVTMYRNGFIVDDGPFRRMDDPENQSFLKDLSQGQVPRELEPPPGQQGQGPVHIALEDRCQEDYRPPTPPPYVAFGGEGQTMGGAQVTEGAVVTGEGEGEVPEVDKSKPSTVLQIRLHDGRRIRAKLNLSHTVQHILAIIRREGGGGAPYILLAGFPPAQITNLSQTLEEAGLKGAQITQKLA